MRYKYVVGLLVALSLGSGLGVAAEVVDIEKADYKGIYGVLTSDCAGLAKIRAVLKNNKDLNPRQDPSIARGQLIGFGLSTAVMGLPFAELQQVVNEHREFFTTTPQGLSYVYGWALNKYEAVVTPRNIGNGFSFNKLFQGMATNIGDSDDAAGIFLSSTFITGLGVVETSREHRWNFFHHMLDLPPAIRELRKTAAAVTVAPTMDAIIAGARRTKAEALTEAVELERQRAALVVEQAAEAQRLRVDQQRREEEERLRVDQQRREEVVRHAQRVRLAHHKATDLAAISTPGYMNYADNKRQYPEKVKDRGFQSFKVIMNKYANEIPDRKTDIAALNALDGDKDLHGDREWGLDGFGYPLRRAAIARVLNALRLYLAV